MRVVACGVSSVLKENLALVVTFRQLTGEESVLLFGIYIADESLLGLEVKRHRVGFVCILTHHKHGCSKFHASGILSSSCIHQTAVETHVYLLALEVHILVFHVGVAI